MSFELTPPDVAAIEGKIQQLGEQYPWLVFENAGAVIGYAYASAHRDRPAYRWCVEVSVYVHDHSRGCGIGRALYTGLFELLRRQEYCNAYAGITLPNPTSVGLHKSMGFVPVGVFSKIGFKLGSWHDVSFLHRRLSDEPIPIEQPLPVGPLFEDESTIATLGQCAEAVRLR